MRMILLSQLIAVEDLHCSGVAEPGQPHSKYKEPPPPPPPPTTKVDHQDHRFQRQAQSNNNSKNNNQHLTRNPNVLNEIHPSQQSIAPFATVVCAQNAAAPTSSPSSS
ncbi:hypothetical protein BJY00DRAFT_119414 [Aspergillus carlsbadensis]|nr:hypothetical protein BJY00DRAFT_119414 [Aspergillus carlsbadensis]